MALTTRWLVWRTELLLRRASAQRRRRLVREIGQYHLPHEREELRLAIERCASPGREEVRRLLERTPVTSHSRDTPLHLRC
jgi:hypothetical protein